MATTGEDLGILAYGIESPVLSPDGASLAYLMWRADDPLTYHPIRLRDLRTGSEVRILGQFSTGHQASWSPDSRHLALIEGRASPDSPSPALVEGFRVVVIDAQTGSITRVLDCGDLHQSFGTPVNCGLLGWSPDGTRLAVALHLDFAPQGDPRQATYILDASCLSVPETCSAQLVRVLPFTYTGTWSPDSRYFASGGAEGDIYIFDLQLWRLEQVIPLRQRITALRWSPDAQWLAYSTEREIGLISVPSGTSQIVAHLGSGATLQFWIAVPAGDETEPAAVAADQWPSWP